MPVGGGKKDSAKKKRTKPKGNSKKSSTINTDKKAPNGKRESLSNFTPANMSSLRWDFMFKDPALENDRIERYKELRRERYANAQQQAIENLIQKMKITATDQ